MTEKEEAENILIVLAERNPCAMNLEEIMAAIVNGGLQELVVTHDMTRHIEDFIREGVIMAVKSGYRMTVMGMMAAPNLKRPPYDAKAVMAAKLNCGEQA